MYNYTKTTKGKFEVGIDKDEQYGYFEHEDYGDEYGGGLWFEDDELVDYDGISGYVPQDVADAIVELGFKISEDFLGDDNE